VAFSTPDGRGELMRALAAFDDEGVSLTRIESRPSRRKAWSYVFLADLEGHRDDAPVARALEKLRAKCPFVKHCGSYPRFVRRTT
ncbi:MAG TPA: ACT domain-containing protein, partial [Polyangiaceae bacterium]